MFIRKKIDVNLFQFQLISEENEKINSDIVNRVNERRCDIFAFVSHRNANLSFTLVVFEFYSPVMKERSHCVEIKIGMLISQKQSNFPKYFINKNFKEFCSAYIPLILEVLALL